MWMPQRLAAIHALGSGVSWDGERLQQEVARRCAVLQGLPVRGRWVLVAHGNTPAFVADLLAVWRAGGRAVCANPGLVAAEWLNAVKFVDAAAVLVDGTATVDVPGVPVLDLATEAGAAAETVATPEDLDAPALMLFTSGTTGAPKGVVHSHRSLQARVALNIAHIGPRGLARSLCVLPTHFGHGLIGNCLTPLAAGGEVFFAPTGVSGSMTAAQQLGAWVREHRISFMSSVPAFWRLALKASAPPPPGLLARVHIGSAPLSAELWREVMRWAGTLEVANLYGITETCNWVGGALGSEHVPSDGLVGRAWGGRYAVLAEDGQVKAQGEGEVLVFSPSLMSGYHQRGDLTAEALFGQAYRTGDLGVLDKTGRLQLTGRCRYVINRAGIKVHPEELDLLFERHPAVAEACAFALPDAAGGEAVGLAVRLHAGAAATPVELQTWAGGQIRREAVPSRIFVVADIPKSERGKLQRDRVAAFCLHAP